MSAGLSSPLAGVGHNGGPEFRPTTPLLPGFGQHKRVCMECAEPFTTDKRPQCFCCEAHKAAFHNRSSKVGRTMVPLAKAWRAGRNAKGKTAKARALRASAARAFAEMCRAIDAAIAEDNAEGRPAALDYLRGRSAVEGTLHVEETIKYQQAQIDRLERELAKAKRELEAAK